MSIRKYGNAPFTVAVLHGGPGAPGYMAPVAEELSNTKGILEPLQSLDSLDGQIEELKNQLTDHADPPVVLIGSSWGAVLALFLATRYPALAKKLVLVGSAVFDAESSSSIEQRRIERLSEEKRQRLQIIESELDNAQKDKQKELFAEWGDILSGADIYDPIGKGPDVIEVQPEIFNKVWPDYVLLRDKPEYLKNEFSKISIPVIVIHGDYDPHPIEGIQSFLENCLENVHFHLLSNCGHYPWLERQARSEFYTILGNEL